MRWLVAAVLISICAVEVMAISNVLHVRAKRQQCKCVRNQAGGLTCSCDKPDVSPGSNLATAEYQQQNELASELQNAQPAQARCACLQIVFMGNPQYQCHCGDINGNPLPTTTTMAPVTTTTPTTTTTTTTTPIPITTTPYQQPAQTTVVNGQGQCQCIMIRISGPSSAHYQCNCQNTPAPGDSTPLPTPSSSTPLLPVDLPASTSTAAPAFPAVGTVNATQEGCFCVDPSTHSIQPHCGCQCDCALQLCTMPMAVASCPQNQFGQPVAAAPPATTMAPTPTLPPQTLPPATLPPVTLPPSTLPPIVPETTPAHTDSSYPLTTTCVMYVGVQATPCTCLPQYDQCAQNICCLKAKYRSYKNTYNDQTAKEPSTIDMLMNVLQKLKNRLE